jgi:hypothetical protein
MLNNERFACTTKHYNSLYARYLKNPGKLLEMAGFNIHHKLLDLCGGTGAIANEALSLGADPKNITLIDLNPRCQNPHIRQLRGRAHTMLHQLVAEGNQFNIIVCRQAFAYLDIENKSGEELAQLLAILIPEGNRFIFNSFVRPRFHAKTYRYEGQRFIELAGHVRRRIFRLQVNLRIGYDLSISKWHREERIYEIFNPWFQIETQWNENAIYWLCTRRSNTLIDIGR